MTHEGSPGDEKNDPSEMDLLELDIDVRLAHLWSETQDVQKWTLEVVAAFMRAAYGKGYADALSEPERGQLTKEHGYRTPRRRARIFPDS